MTKKEAAKILREWHVIYCAHYNYAPIQEEANINLQAILSLIPDDDETAWQPFVPGWFAAQSRKDNPK